jgi:hypothetical protein
MMTTNWVYHTGIVESIMHPGSRLISSMAKTAFEENEEEKVADQDDRAV